MVQEVVDAAFAPFADQLGWHGLAYGMLFYKTLHAALSASIRRAFSHGEEGEE